ncbi:MAG: DUF2934 domain-containing protein [Fibrobacter sp.]|nr:DUF2934 domain-containing protein [Fibrobacter sp.]
MRLFFNLYLISVKLICYSQKIIEITPLKEAEVDIRSKIEKRAYELFLARGARHGYHMQDWEQAEKEVMAEINAQQKTQKKAEPEPKAEPKVEQKVEQKVEPKVEPKKAPAQKEVEPEQKKAQPAKKRAASKKK